MTIEVMPTVLKKCEWVNRRNSAMFVMTCYKDLSNNIHTYSHTYSRLWKYGMVSSTEYRMCNIVCSRCIIPGEEPPEYENTQVVIPWYAIL